MKTPVVLLVFNRPACTEELMTILRRAEPPVLLVVGDGPRPGRPDDAERCARVRDLATQVDWPCELLTEFSPHNLGCGPRVASGIDWAFTHIDRAVILEDDLRPDPSFFPFADAMLERYADETRVMQVSGRNPIGAWDDECTDYLFSRSASGWGWATWRRAWSAFDLTLARYQSDPVTEAVRARAVDEHHAELLTWLLTFDVATGMRTWDISWFLAVFANDGLCVVPRRNLIGNVGFDAEATHTTDPDDFGAAVSVASIEPPFRGPAVVEPDLAFDRALEWFERAREIANPRAAALVHRLLQHPEASQSPLVTPAVRHALVTFDHPDEALSALRHVRAHSRPWPALNRRIAELAAVCTDAVGATS